MPGMTLSQMRTSVLAKGFDATVYSGQINQWINDAKDEACRRALFSTDEGTYDFATVAGTTLYPLPTDLVSIRSLRDTDVDQELVAVELRDIDRSSHTTTGQPFAYAQDAANLHLYPSPDGAHNLELRYWKLPADLVADGDTPTFPATYHRMLVYWAVAECYWSEDDFSTGQQWEARFEKLLSKFEADVKFPDEDVPTRIRGMWDSDRGLSPRAWTRYGWGI